MAHSVRIVAAAVAVACTSLVFASVGNAGASSARVADPPHTVRVGPFMPSTEGDLLEPVAGSSSFLVYTRTVQTAGGDMNSPSPTDQATRTLFARSRSGATISLGHITGAYDNFSLVGSTLLAAADAAGGRVTVRWWSVTSGATSSTTLPVGDSLISAAPGGFVYSKNGELFKRLTSGNVTDLGSPFPGETGVRGAAGDAGLVVVAGSNDIAYLRFDTPGNYVSLQADTTLALRCDAVTETYTGCVGIDGDDSVRQVLLIPLTGGSPTSSTDHPGDVAVAGSTLLWKGRVVGVDADAYNDLQSLPAGSSNVTVSTTGLSYGSGPAFVSAYGAGVGITPSRARIISVTSAASPARTVKPEVDSPVTAAVFALTTGRIAYVADERVTGSSQRLSTFSAALRTEHTKLKAFTPAAIHAGAYYTDIAASGKATVYETFTAGDSVTLHVVVPSRATHDIAGVYRYSHPSLSGNRLLYLKAGTSKGRSTSTYYVYDLTTRKTTKVLTDPTQCCVNEPVLAGQYIAYVKPDGSIWRKNLHGGSSVQLAPARKRFDDATLYAAGDHVAWEIDYTATAANRPTEKTVDYYRNATTRTAAVALPPNSLVGLSTSGVILGRFPAGKGLGYAAASYSLRTFSGKTITLLPAQVLNAYPQIVGSTMAWIDGHGTLKATHIAT